MTRFVLSGSWPVTALRAMGDPINPRRRIRTTGRRVVSRHPLALRPLGRRLLWSLAADRREEYRLIHLKGIVPYLPIHNRATVRWFAETEEEDRDG